ncbi:MAG: hypothetical protein WD801_03920 [Gemmatimonadaceae bacterium]
MRILKIWLLAVLGAGAILGVLSVTEMVDARQLRELARMTVLAIVVLAATHYAWIVMRGRANPSDHTDKPVP